MEDIRELYLELVNGCSESDMREVNFHRTCESGRVRDDSEGSRAYA